MKVITLCAHDGDATEHAVIVELGVVVSKRGRDIPESEAESYVAGYGTVPLDYTGSVGETDSDPRSSRGRHDCTQPARGDQGQATAMDCCQGLRHFHAHQV